MMLFTKSKVTSLSFALVLSMLLAVCLSEVFIKYIVGFPDFGVEQYVIGLDPRGFDKSRIYKPQSAYYTTENGFRVYHRNNIGLIGNDLVIGKKNVFLLGSSYIEAKEVDPAQTASSVLNRKLSDSNRQVINIGYRGCTAYEQYLRYMYFSKSHSPNAVILVLDSIYEQWYEQRRFAQLSPKSIKNFGRRDVSVTHNAYRIIRNSLSTANLMIPGLLTGKNKEDKATAENTTNSKLRSSPNIAPLVESIKLIAAETDSLYILSIVGDAEIDKLLESQLKTLKVKFFSANLKTPQFMINGGGHFNVKGNAVLGDLLFMVLSEGEEQ